MRRFIDGIDRGQITLFPDRPEGWIANDNPVRVTDVFVHELDLAGAWINLNNVPLRTGYYSLCFAGG